MFQPESAETEYAGCVKYAAFALLAIGILLTILLIQADRNVPGTYTRWGVPNMTSVLMLIVARLLTLVIGFSLLLAGKSLDTWASSGIWRVLLVITGLLILEGFAFSLHERAIPGTVAPPFQIAHVVLATLLPLTVIAAGFSGSRALFLAGVIATLLTGIIGNAGEETFMKLQRPYQSQIPPNADMRSLLSFANPMYDPVQLQDAFTRIEQRPNWIEEAAGLLEDKDSQLEALYVLGRRADRLDPALQDRCWRAASTATASLDRDLQQYGQVLVVSALRLAEAVKGLAAVSSDLRDRHREDFVRVRDYSARARPNNPSLPDLAASDWRKQE